MSKFCIRKLNATALALIALSTFSSGSVYGMEDIGEDSPAVVKDKKRKSKDTSPNKLIKKRTVPSIQEVKK